MFPSCQPLNLLPITTEIIKATCDPFVGDQFDFYSFALYGKDEKSNILPHAPEDPLATDVIIQIGINSGRLREICFAEDTTVPDRSRKMYLDYSESCYNVIF